MKVWSIQFEGIWPVGSAAIACTRDNEGEEVAVEAFHRLWTDAHPNQPLRYPSGVKAELLDCQPGAVHILADGEY